MEISEPRLFFRLLEQRYEIYPLNRQDFWRVLIADTPNRRLLLYAEMKLPGEAWLEFKIEEQTLIQTAIFRSHGVG